MSKMDTLRSLIDSVPVCHRKIDYSITDLPVLLEKRNINLNPDYQRASVWTIEQKKKFMGSLLLDSTRIPCLWLNSPASVVRNSEVLDGKQRILAILGWLDNEYPAIFPNSDIEIFYRDLDSQMETYIDNHCIINIRFVNLDRNNAIKFYLNLNSGGTVHTDEELQRARDLL